MNRISVERLRTTFRRLQWKLTLSYTAVTVGSLLVVVFIFGYLSFSKVLVPIDIVNTEFSPQAWIQAASRNASPRFQYILSQDPVDTHLLSMMLREGDLQVSYFDVLRIGDLQVRLRTTGKGSVLLVSPDGILLGTSDPGFVAEEAIGQPLDMGVLPGLEEPIETALRGEVDPERLFVTLEKNERFYFVVPYFDETQEMLLGVGIVNFESLPTESDIPANVILLLSQSALILFLAAGLVGTLFGALTAKGMVRRLKRVSEVTGAWSRGDFSQFIEDPAGDEISKLSVSLNYMAEQLQHFLKRNQEMAVSEERNRLARDLHDSAKQEALAASLHLGTALTLFERDPEAAKTHLLEADNLVDSVRRELTNLIDELRPVSTGGARFDETICEYLIEWSHQTGIETSLQVEGFTELPLEIKQAIYRIMQESLANVARHSSASNAEVVLDFKGEGVKFSVQDDGCGFDIQQPRGGLGLASMRERAESLQGEFVLESEAGRGTRIWVTFPPV